MGEIDSLRSRVDDRDRGRSSKLLRPRQPRGFQGKTPRRELLHRSNAALPGFARVPDDSGFAYRDVNGAPLTDPAALARIRALAIPPAWRDVWICPDPLGHLQATGVDAAGRRQYRYHELWSQQQAHAKFEHMLAFARTLPTMRERVLATMRAGRHLDRGRVLACSVRLLDVGMFRIGGEVYEKEDGHLGLATIAKTNVSIEEGRAQSSTTSPRRVSSASTPSRTPAAWRSWAL